ncbi:MULTISPECIES: ribokinase [Staphylococcus]|uniref:Ribokinase n=1 Tax=Staphylococcus lugdunensis TaxID=28035 RepID=A0ABX6BTM0_STALU|nr:MULTISPECIES: ribokinase [Staphylococcus]ADC86440.1 Ribokinase [Staphylococcus lugdunensis HKU09-01]ARJ08187.1 ribokinase [Staphylococcus lugdunensis]ARJ15280.1 ribokinase [Staphylococcus lugdunensis]ARJ28663.1 ribokinase [Staphylococcus lugdunensis]EKS22667.1 ribokinase [Staphylococcus lugdunensis ACS-027-V-Sch2]
MKRIYVVGSMSMDLVVSTKRVSQKGETILGASFFTTPGGKGANQAVAAARLGEQVYMVGRIGDDQLGEEIYENLQRNKVRVDYVKPVADSASGTAHITLCDNDNSIIVVPSANNEVTSSYVSTALKHIKAGDIVLLQQEIPEDTVSEVITYCAEHDIITILNPAPYRDLTAEVIDQATYLTPNETESAAMFGTNIDAALEQFPNKLIVTLGHQGAVYHNGNIKVMIPGFERQVVDTTGAGDTFNGAFAVGLQKGYDIDQALTFANLAASHAVTGMGAQGGMPYFNDLVDEFDVK